MLYFILVHTVHIYVRQGDKINYHEMLTGLGSCSLNVCSILTRLSELLKSFNHNIMALALGTCVGNSFYSFVQYTELCIIRQHNQSLVETCISHMGRKPGFLLQNRLESISFQIL
jgi:hypothetical protein